MTGPGAKGRDNSRDVGGWRWWADLQLDGQRHAHAANRLKAVALDPDLMALCEEKMREWADQLS